MSDVFMGDRGKRYFKFGNKYFKLKRKLWSLEYDHQYRMNTWNDRLNRRKVEYENKLRSWDNNIDFYKQQNREIPYYNNQRDWCIHKYACDTKQLDNQIAFIESKFVKDKGVIVSQMNDIKRIMLSLVVTDREMEIFKAETATG